MDDDRRYASAKTRVTLIKSFYLHALVYGAVNTGLFAINMASGGGVWFHWPLIGWGIGLAAHGILVFGNAGVFGPEWEQRKIREFIEKAQTA